MGPVRPLMTIPRQDYTHGVPIEAIALSIIDRLIQLLTVKERNREKVFSNYIEPLYRDAEPVAKDYMSLMVELKHRLETATSVTELVNWLEERRVAYQAIRMTD